MAESGKKMGDYTPLESNKKEYFFGDGEGGVVAVGKTEAAGEKTNPLVKLSDIAGDKLPATTSADAGKALHVGSDGVPVFKFAELRQMPDVVQQSASDNGHIFTNNTYTKVILKYNTDQDLYSPQVNLASDELLNCIIDIYIDSTYSLDGHDLFIMFDIQRNGGSLKQIARPLTGDHFNHLEKGSYIRIYALGDSWSAQVGIPWNTPGWLPCQLVPPAETGDSGKMLQVLDTNGTLGWGIGIPAPANGDVGKVLTASTSEGHLVAAWESASGGGGGGGMSMATVIPTYSSETAGSYKFRIIDVNVENNTYARIKAITRDIFGDGGYDSNILHIRVNANAITDFINAVIEIEQFEDDTTGYYGISTLRYIVVDSEYDFTKSEADPSNEGHMLKAIYPGGISGDAVNPYDQESTMELNADAIDGQWSQFHILGRCYRVYDSKVLNSYIS